MKHIKTYTLYERVSKETKVFESTELDLKDILLELKDMGYRIIYQDDVLYAVTGEPSDI